MTMIRCFILILTLCFLGGPPVWAEPTVEELTEQLQAAATKAAQAAMSKSGQNGGMNVELIPFASQFTTAIQHDQANGNLSSLGRNLAQLQAVLPDLEIQRLSAALLEQAGKEMAAKQQAYIELMDAAVAKAVEACLAAKEPKELDEPLVELTKVTMQTGNSLYSEPSRHSNEMARAAVSFVCRWQDYLMQAKTGNIGGVQATLSGIARDSAKYPFVPRSEILSRMPPRGKGVNASGEGESELPSLEGKKLSDLEELVALTQELRSLDGNSTTVRHFADQLQDLDQAYQQLHMGLVGQAFRYSVQKGDRTTSDAFNPLRQELLLETLPLYLDTVETYPVLPNDTPMGYLLRIVKEARAKGDWLGVWKALDVYRTVAFNAGETPIWLGTDIQAIAFYISGQNLEGAGEYVGAIRAYKSVLTQPGKYCPVKEATERLIALKKARSADYEAAMGTAASKSSRPR